MSDTTSDLPDYAPPGIEPYIEPDTSTLTVCVSGRAQTVHLSTGTITLAGSNGAEKLGTYGVTRGVPAAAFEAWLAANATLPLVTSGNLIVLSRQP